MKRSMFLYMVCLSLMASIQSCNKSVEMPRQVPLQTQTLNLVARNWEKIADEVYSATLKGVLNQGSNSNPTVFLKTQGREFLISFGGIVFMNGHLRAECSNADIQLVYRYFGTDARIPFSYLEIKIVF